VIPAQICINIKNIYYFGFFFRFVMVISGMKLLRNFKMFEFFSFLGEILALWTGFDRRFSLEM
jgi:hypothetical protein